MTGSEGGRPPTLSRANVIRRWSINYCADPSRVSQAPPSVPDRAQRSQQGLRLPGINWKVVARFPTSSGQSTTSQSRYSHQHVVTDSHSDQRVCWHAATASALRPIAAATNELCPEADPTTRSRRRDSHATASRCRYDARRSAWSQYAAPNIRPKLASNADRHTPASQRETTAVSRQRRALHAKRPGCTRTRPGAHFQNRPEVAA